MNRGKGFVPGKADGTVNRMPVYRMMTVQVDCSTVSSIKIYSITNYLAYFNFRFASTPLSTQYLN